MGLGLRGLSGLSGLITSDGFTPLDVAGLTLWLDAEVGTFQDAAGLTPAILDNAPVGRWSDQSGIGNHATQANNAKRPTLKLNIVNGRPIIRFDGLSHTLASVATSALTSNNGATVFAVLQISVNGDSPCGAFGGSQRLYLFTEVLRYTGGFLDVTTGSLRSTTALQAGFVLQTLSGQANAAVNNYISNVSENNAVTGNFVFTANPFYIGAANDSFFMAGDIAELLVYNLELSNGNRLLVSNYLNARYSLY